MVTFLIGLIIITVIAVAYIRLRGPRVTEPHLTLDRDSIRERLLAASERGFQRPEREPSLWAERTHQSVRDARFCMLRELPQMQPSDWERFVFRAIVDKTPNLRLYVPKGKLDIETMERRERQGIEVAIQAIEQVSLGYHVTLRSYFRALFDSIVQSCQTDNPFYMHGVRRVILALRSFRASDCDFVPQLSGPEAPEYKEWRSKFDVVGALAVYFAQLEKKKRNYNYEHFTDNPVMEFNLERIDDAGYFEYQGSLINCLYLELLQRLHLWTGQDIPRNYIQTDMLYNRVTSVFIHDLGKIILVKVCGAVDYYPDRLFIEFENIDKHDQICRDLHAYKLHIEGNG